MRAGAWKTFIIPLLLAGVAVVAQEQTETVAPGTEKDKDSKNGASENRRSEGGDSKRPDSISSRRPLSFSPSRGRSSAEYLREYLAMTPEQLELVLAEKPEHWRKLWNAKVEEYKALSAYDREVRLQTTQMTYYLDQVLHLRPEYRQARLNSIPEDFRPLVEERLNQWNELPWETRKAVLDNKRTMEYFSRLEAAPPDQKDTVFQVYSPEYRQQIERRLAEWRERPKDERQQMYDQFNRFFQLSMREKEKILATLSAPDREQTDAILDQFEKLPPEQRKACIDSFRKFVNMTPEQRAEFYRNAAKWQKMRPEDKSAWRSTVQQLPPLPPGLRPMPPGFAPGVAPWVQGKPRQ